MQILYRVNNEVSQNKFGNRVQMPEAKKGDPAPKTCVQAMFQLKKLNSDVIKMYLVLLKGWSVILVLVPFSDNLHMVC